MKLAALLLAAALALGACGEDSESSSSAGTPAAPSCDKASLELHTAGTLTVGTDKPAYPPYFVDDDPANGKGFESAVAYAIADQLGFSKDEVEWIVVPFNASYAPGPKKFDFDVNQISITPQRAQQVDFSTPYYEAKQAIRGAEGLRGGQRQLARGGRGGPGAERRPLSDQRRMARPFPLRCPASSRSQGSDDRIPHPDCAPRRARARSGAGRSRRLRWQR